MSGTDQPSGGAIYYTVVGSFVGAAAGGAWLGLVVMSVAGLYGNMALWEDLLASVVAGTIVVTLAVLCSRAVGRLSGLRVVLAAALATLNVAIVLYLFGTWVCEVSTTGPAFINCRLPAPLGGLGPARASLFLSPTILAALAGAVLSIRDLRRFGGERPKESANEPEDALE